MQPRRHPQPGRQGSLDEILIRNDLAELISPEQRGRARAPGDGPGGVPRQQTNPGDALDAVAIDHGLAELVPRQRRGRAPLALRLAMLLLTMAALLGLPLAGILLCLVFAMVLEAVDDARQQHASWPVALARPSFWERARPPFYWSFAAGVGLVALLLARESLLLSLLRVGILWLGCRGIEDLVRHPERYRSIGTFVSWVDRLGHHVDRAWGVWLSTVVLAIAAGFAVNLIAPGIWAAVGNTGWDRLLLAGGGLYLLAMLAFLRFSRSMTRSAVREGMQNLGDPGAGDYHNALGPLSAQQGSRYTSPGTTEQIEQALAWKQVGSLVARVGPKLEHSLVQRLRWSAFFANLMAYLLAFFFLAAGIFLIIPRDVIAGWVAAGGTSEREIVLALDDLEELVSPEYVQRLLALDWPTLAQEPIPKVVFVEAVLLAVLMLLRAATDRSALRRMADTDESNVRRWLLLGTAYLLLLEEGFQYVYGGLVTRQVTGDGTFRTTTLPNEVLLAPSVTSKAAVYRAIGNFHQVYGPSKPRGTTPLMTVFANQGAARDWAMTFLRFPSLAGEQPLDPVQLLPPKPEDGPRKYWLWSGGQMVDLMSFEEAQWYGRFAAHRT